MKKKAEESWKIHKLMIEKIKEIEKIRGKADEAQQNFLDFKEKLSAVKKEIAEVLEQISLLRKEDLMKEEEERKRKEEILREEIRKKAEEKLKHGKKVTWEEFKILSEDKGKED